MSQNLGNLQEHPFPIIQRAGKTCPEPTEMVEGRPGKNHDKGTRNLFYYRRIAGFRHCAIRTNTLISYANLTQHDSCLLRLLPGFKNRSFQSNRVFLLPHFNHLEGYVRFLWGIKMGLRRFALEELELGARIFSFWIFLETRKPKLGELRFVILVEAIDNLVQHPFAMCFESI